MTTKSQAFDHPAYLVHMGTGPVEVGPTAATAYAKFIAFTSLQVYSATFTVTTAGTAAGHIYTIQRVNSTATTSIGIVSFGTAAIGVSSNVVLGTQATGGFSLVQGEFIQALSGSDGTGKAVVGYEYSVTPLANITA